MTIDRHESIEELNTAGIGTSVHFVPLHIHPYYREVYGHEEHDLPVAKQLFERSVSLPICSRMTQTDIERVVDVVTDVASQRAAPRAARA